MHIAEQAIILLHCLSDYLVDIPMRYGYITLIDHDNPALRPLIT